MALMDCLGITRPWMIAEKNRWGTIYLYLKHNAQRGNGGIRTATFYWQSNNIL